MNKFVKTIFVAMQRIIHSVWSKFLDIIHYPVGWFAGFGLFLADAVSGGRFIVYTVVVASVIDLACGIAVSRKKKEFTLSELIRQTVGKLAIYGPALLVFLCLDKMIASETSLEIAITSGVVGAVITMAEAWSFSASLLILFPKNAFLRLMQKALTGEIARKLGCDEDEVNKILNTYRKDKPARNAKGQFIAKN